MGQVGGIDEDTDNLTAKLGPGLLAASGHPLKPWPSQGGQVPSRYFYEDEDSSRQFEGLILSDGCSGRQDALYGKGDREADTSGCFSNMSGFQPSEDGSFLTTKNTGPASIFDGSQLS